MSLENLNKASHYSKYFGKFYRCDTWVILGMACSDVSYLNVVKRFVSLHPTKSTAREIESCHTRLSTSLGQRNALGSAHK
jgi:hypothetical protein